MKNFLIDFGFREGKEYVKDFRNTELGPRENKREKLFWTVLVYVFLSSGIFFRRTVIDLDPIYGINCSVFKWGIVGASFIIGLAILAPLLRMISRLQKGKLSWEHCLTAFSIGFFGDLTFDFLITNFVGRLNP